MDKMSWNYPRLTSKNPRLPGMTALAGRRACLGSAKKIRLLGEPARGTTDMDMRTGGGARNGAAEGDKWNAGLA